MTVYKTPSNSLNVENYKNQMLEYFKTCSAKLHEWYQSGGAETPEYKQEYQKYMNEVEKFKALMSKYDSENANLISPASTHESVSRYAAYYKQMLSYFNQLISTLPDDQIKPTPREKNTQHDDSSEPPLNIMEDYYYAFGRKGEWSYESWNSYLSMLARNNPQWFSIFQQFSQSQGIDWKLMYEHWCSNQPKSEALSYNNVLPKPPTNVSSKSAKKSTPADNEDCIYCYDCEIGFDNRRKYMKHLRGLTHMQKALEKTSLEDNPSVFEDAGALDVGFPTQLNYFIQSAPLDSAPPSCLDYQEEEQTTFCDVCGVECGSVLYYMFHQNGDKHREKVKQLGLEVTHSPLQSKLRIQPRIEVSEEALVGLNHLTEYQVVNPGQDDYPCMTIYFCDLCERMHRNQEKAFSHLYGKSHRRNYLKRYYKHLFQLISFDKSCKKAKLERLDAYASELYEQPELKEPLELEQRMTDKQDDEEHIPIAWSDFEQRKRKSDSPCRELSPFRNPTVEENPDPTLEEYIEMLQNKGCLKFSGHESYSRRQDQYAAEIQWTLSRRDFLGIKRRKFEQTIPESNCPSDSNVVPEFSATDDQPSDPLDNPLLSAFLDELTAKFKETKEPEPVVKAPEVVPLPSLLTNPMQTVNQLLSKASVQKAEEGEVVSDTEASMDQDPAEIFDAYSFVSTRNPQTSSTSQSKPVIVSSSSSKKQVKQSKLSAYADLLGINEPPPPVEHYAPPTPIQHQHESVYCTPSNKNDNLLSLAQSLANLSQMINKPNAAPAMIPITALQPQLLFANPAFLTNPFLQTTTQPNTQ